MPSSTERSAQLVQLFGDIGYDITDRDIAAQLSRLDRSAPLLVEINSYGGSVAQGVAMYNLLRKWEGGVTVEIVGWACSIASLIAMAGARIRMHETSLMMIHAPWVSTVGNAFELRVDADKLDTMTTTMVETYRRSGQTHATRLGWMDGEDHYFLADQAVALGLADEVIPNAERAAVAFAPSAHAFSRRPLPPHIQRIVSAMPTPHNTQAPAGGQPNATLAERRRREEVRAVFDSSLEVPGVIAAMRICEQDPDCNVIQARAVLLDTISRGSTPVAGSYSVSVDAEADRMRDFKAAAADVLLMRGGIKLDEPHPAARDLQRLSVVAMAERMLSMMGKSTRNLSNSEILALSLSTSDFPILLSAVSNKSLRDGYEHAPATFVGWTGEREVSDFKQQTLAAMSEAPALLKVGEGGEYMLGDFDESASNFKLETFGRMLNITRQALVNDDLGAFTRMPQAFGASARRLEADATYATLTSTANLADGQPLFHAARGNLAAVGAALSIVSLGEARAAMRLQKGQKGLGYLDPQPRYLIVPVALETTAEQLLASLVDPTKSNATPSLEWIRGLQLASDPRLDAVSETAWYLAADPSQMDGIVRAYLAGEQRPHLEEGEVFVRDVLSFKARLDLGVGVIDYRGLYKNPGA